MVKDRFCNPDKLLHCSLAFIALFLVQVFAGKSGWFVADLFSYDSLDPDHLFARLSVHPHRSNADCAGYYYGFK